MASEMIFILELGLILTLGIIGSDTIKKLHLPEILGFILMGILVGILFRPFGLFQEDYTDITNIVVAIALGFIGFNLGSELDWKIIKSMSKKVFVVLMFEGLITFFIVGAIVYLITTEFYIALLFGALSSATAPAGTAAVFWEYECRGPLTTTTMLILALDDILAIILVDFALDYSGIYLEGTTVNLFHLLFPVIFDVGLSLLIGLIIGIPLSYKLNKEEEHGEFVDLIIGTVLVCIGISGILGISYILPTMVFGITVASITKKPVISQRKKKLLEKLLEKSQIKDMKLDIEQELLTISEDSVAEPHQVFHEVFRIASPIVALFFVLIGLSLDLSSLTQIGFLGIVYMIGRTLAKTFGAYLGASIVNAEEVVRKYLGPCLYSQAGVALGLAVLISEKLTLLGEPTVGILILNTITATTVIFQIFGPIAIKWAVDKAGESNICD